MESCEQLQSKCPPPQCSFIAGVSPPPSANTSVFHTLTDNNARTAKSLSISHQTPRTHLVKMWRILPSASVNAVHGAWRLTWEHRQGLKHVSGFDLQLLLRTCCCGIPGYFFPPAISVSYWSVSWAEIQNKQSLALKSHPSSHIRAIAIFPIPRQWII